MTGITFALAVDHEVWLPADPYSDQPDSWVVEINEHIALRFTGSPGLGNVEVARRAATWLRWLADAFDPDLIDARRLDDEETFSLTPAGRHAAVVSELVDLYERVADGEV